MSTRLEVQSAIEQLPKDEIRDLAKWLQEYIYEKCDRQIESDISFQLSPSDPEFIEQMEVAQTVMHEDRTLLRKLAQ